VVKALEILREKLPDYIIEVKEKHSENAKAIAFSSFIQKVFQIESKDIDFEVPVRTEVMEMRGRIDAVFGNLIIEFKKDLRKNIDQAEEELLKYLQSYNEKYHDSKFIGIATDGIRFKVYHPVYEKNVITKIEEIDKINLEEKQPEEIFLWFDVYLFTTEKIVPTSIDIKKRFGLESPTFATILRKLEELFEKVQIFKPALIKFENWNRYLEVVYGDKPNEKRLFFTHTYLSTFVKLLVHVKITGGNPSKMDEMVPILFGNTFSRAGIKNFMEEDFFMWVMSLPIRKQASKLFHELLREIYVYDLEKIDEDILKELYQELVEPDVRKLLGEFYTPDWLADTMIGDVLRDDPKKVVMDPSCGSGTFLFKTIQYKINELSKSGWTNAKILEHIIDNVIGFDIHPLAVVIAKTNYLLALKDILSSRTGSVSIPVYLSDSLKIPTEKVDVSKNIRSFEFEALDKKFQFPISVASDMKKMETIVEKMKELGHELENKIEAKNAGYRLDVDEYVRNVIANFDQSIKMYSEEERMVLKESVLTLFDLIKSDSDAIWTYVLRNMYKPVAIAYKKVDVIIGNPPWLALNAMKNMEYQNYLKRKSLEYNIADRKKINNIPNLELATLFFCQSVQQYLSKDGMIAFVMPRSVLVGSQHLNFLKFEKPLIKLIRILDLKQVEPLFRIPSCVLIGKVGGKTTYPVNSFVFAGKLPSTNAQLSLAKSLLRVTKSTYEPARRSTSISYYHDKFLRGADVIPRCFWFVDIKTDSFLGFNPVNPQVKSTENANAKAPWKNVMIEGNIDRDFLFNTILSNDLLPFGSIKRSLVFLPIFVKNSKVQLITNSDQIEIQYNETSEYLKKVEQNWSKYNKEKSKKMSAYKWLNYRNKLTIQNPSSKFKVLYATSGTYLTSAIIKSDKKYNFDINNNDFETKYFLQM